VSYRLEDQQIIGGSLEEVFAFFKDPRNLETLTPAFLGFRVAESTDQVVRLNTQISYRLQLHGIPMRWTSRITEYVEGELFADEMLSGPYRRWYHRHLFRTVPGGVEIRDIVEYELPFGIFGRLAHTLFVRRQLQAIFAHRTRVIATLFPGPSPFLDHQAVAE
jgi:ligand-binding SRPBCC domain-containing protein